MGGGRDSDSRKDVVACLSETARDKVARIDSDANTNLELYYSQGQNLTTLAQEFKSKIGTTRQLWLHATDCNHVANLLDGIVVTCGQPHRDFGRTSSFYLSPADEIDASLDWTKKRFSRLPLPRPSPPEFAIFIYEVNDQLLPSVSPHADYVQTDAKWISLIKGSRSRSARDRTTEQIHADTCAWVYGLVSNGNPLIPLALSRRRLDSSPHLHQLAVKHGGLADAFSKSLKAIWLWEA